MTGERNIPWDLEGMRILVVGAARTGRATARFLREKGARVWVVEKENEEKFPMLRQEMEALGIQVEFGPHRKEPFLWAEGIVVSPGVPKEMDLLQMALKRGVSVVGELELASWFFPGPIVAITGTNGKTTTTTLVGLALEAWGRRTFVGGNIGRPFVEALREDPIADVAVLEVSSFQLETTVVFKPHVSAILNLTEDHLDRHPSMEDYIRAKARIFLCQGKGDFAVVNKDDPLAMGALPSEPRMEVLTFTLDRGGGSAWSRDSKIFWKTPQGTFELDIKGTALCGPHGLQNSMAAALCCGALGCPRWAVEKAVKDFKGLEHRTEEVGEARGVIFVNDSKATNVGAVMPAIMGARGKVIWIGGGKYKGIDFSPLRGPLKEKGRAAVLIGEASCYLKEALKGVIPVYEAGRMEEAVPLAFSLAEPGDTVLLSPACSSFDQYSSYEERGRHFKELVRGLIEKLHAHQGGEVDAPRKGFK